MTNRWGILGFSLLALALLNSTGSLGRGAELPPSPADSTNAQELRPSSAAAPGDSAQSFGTERFGLLQRATLLLHKKVEDRSFGGVGKLTDLILNLPSGQVVAGVVGSSPTSRQTLVPAQAFWVVDKNEIVLRVTRRTFRRAPAFEPAVYGCPPEPGSVVQAFGYFHEEPPALASGAAAGSVCATTLIGSPLLSNSNATLAHVQDVMLDVPRGRVVYLVVEPLAGEGAPADLYVVPPAAVKREPTGALSLALGQADFLAGPRFQRTFWSAVNFPELGMAVNEHYGLSTGSEAFATAREPARAFVPGTNTSNSAAPGPSDEAITQAILQEIVREGRSWPARGVTINTSKGHVTLSGPVKNEQQRRQIVADVARIVGPTNVNDHLEVHSEQ